MTVKELMHTLRSMGEDEEVKIWIDHSNKESIVALQDEHLYYTSDGAYIDSCAPEDEWDAEEGKITHKGTRFLLINPSIV